MNQRAFLYTSLLLFIGLLNPLFPELRSNVCPENPVAKLYPLDILNVNFSIFRTFNVKEEIPVNPLTKKHVKNDASSQPLSDQCYFKVGHRIIADKGPESTFMALSGIFLDDPFNGKQFLYGLPLAIFSSRHGNTVKIRPPPEY